MGFLDKVKRAVTGPVAISIAVPDTFRWTDEALTVVAQLTNDTDEPLIIAEVRFTLEAHPSGGANSTKSRLKLTVSGPFALDPGMTVDTTGEFPLTIDAGASTMKAAATDAGLPTWTGHAMKSVTGEIPRRSGRHKISVTVKLDGSARLSSGSTAVSAV